MARFWKEQADFYKTSAQTSDNINKILSKKLQDKTNQQ
jgi:hypothetical protein